MKKEKSEVLRINEIINGDRLSEKDQFNQLLNKDLTMVLSEYFDIKEKPFVELNKKNNSIEVNIFFRANAIKNFSVMPK